MGMPAYSEEGMLARDVFFAGVARIHFFVEDEDLENVYFSLFDRLFPRLESFEVFPLCGKGNVLAHSKLPTISGVVRVYVLDKDFDDILGKVVQRDSVFYLDHYNVEMAIVDESALLTICVEERPRIRRSDLRARLQFIRSTEEWTPLLDRLHRAFALVQKYDLGLPNVDQPPERFTMAGDPSSLVSALVDAYIEQVIQALVDAAVIVSRDEYPELSRRIFGTARLYPRHINGKFVSRLWYHRMKRRRLVSNLTQDSLLMRSVASSELKGFSGFKRRVARYLRENI